MLETELVVDGRVVRLRASAAVPRLYRIKFHRDLIQDMQTVQQAMKSANENAESNHENTESNHENTESNHENVGSTLPVEALELFEKMSYIMAKHGDPQGTPGTVEEWLDQFQVFSIYQIFPVVMALWQGNMESLTEAKKKLEQ